MSTDVPHGPSAGDDEAPIGGRPDALAWMAIGALALLLGAVRGSAFLLAVGVFLLLPGAMILVLDRADGGHPARLLPAAADAAAEAPQPRDSDRTKAATTEDDGAGDKRFGPVTEQGDGLY